MNLAELSEQIWKKAKPILTRTAHTLDVVAQVAVPVYGAGNQTFKFAKRRNWNRKKTFEATSMAALLTAVASGLTSSKIEDLGKIYDANGVQVHSHTISSNTRIDGLLTPFPRIADTFLNKGYRVTLADNNNQCLYSPENFRAEFGPNGRVAMMVTGEPYLVSVPQYPSVGPFKRDSKDATERASFNSIARECADAIEFAQSNSHSPYFPTTTKRATELRNRNVSLDGEITYVKLYPQRYVDSNPVWAERYDQFTLSDRTGKIETCESYGIQPGKDAFFKEVLQPQLGSLPISVRVKGEVVEDYGKPCIVSHTVTFKDQQFTLANL